MDFDTDDLQAVGVKRSRGGLYAFLILLLLAGGAIAVYMVDPTVFGLLAPADSDSTTTEQEQVAGLDETEASGAVVDPTGEQPSEPAVPSGDDPVATGQAPAPGTGDVAGTGDLVAGSGEEVGTGAAPGSAVAPEATGEAPEATGEEPEEEEEDEEEDEEDEDRGSSRPRGFDGYMDAGRAALDRDDLDEALEHYAAAAESRPSNAEAQAAVGRVYAEMGRHRIAAARYETATELNPRYMPAWIGLADALRRSGDTSGAIDAYRQVISINSSHRYADRAREALTDLGESP